MMESTGIREVIDREITVVGSSQQIKRIESLAVEEPLEIRISGIKYPKNQSAQYSLTMRTPGDDESLIIGLLFSEGVILDKSDIHKIQRIDDNVMELVLSETAHFRTEDIQNRMVMNSSCGICGKKGLEAMTYTSRRLSWASKERIRSETLKKLPEQLLLHQKQFSKTGGVHAAGLFDHNGTLIIVKEDVGRHNAMDKLVGSAIGLNIDPHLILVSGRTSYELAQKAAMLGAGILASIGPASSLAIDIAEQEGITLIGFLRKDRYNIYCHPERIIFD